MHCYAQSPVVDGWTQFAPSSDSRIIYVSATTGNDGTGQFYAPNAPEIGPDPFNPIGSINAYQTLAAAAAHLRNGFPDWILFKQGDVFTHQSFGSTVLNGRNRHEPMLIGAYGNSPQRPIIRTGDQSFIDLQPPSASFLAFVGLQIEPHTRSGADEPIGIRIIYAPFDHVWIEDCHISSYFQNLAIHDPLLPELPTRSNLIVRRNTIVDAFVTTASHANAMFIANIDTILFEENLLDHNGWSNTIANADPTGFRHNSYFQVSCRNLTFRENIVARAAATGGGFRCGGTIYNNTFLSNPKNLQFGTSETTIDWPTEFVTGEISYNVILDSRTEIFEPGRGMNIQRAKNATAHHNIMAHFTPVSDYNTGVFFDETENIEVHDNIIYKWGNNTSSGPAYASGIAVGGSLLGTNSVHGNDVQMENLKGHCMAKYGSFSNADFSDNRYHNVAAANDWFSPSGNHTNWLLQSGESGSILVDVPYLDPERNVSSYLSSLSMAGGLVDFLDQRRTLSKNNWNDDLSADAFNEYIRQGFGMDQPVAIRTRPTEADGISVYPNPSASGIFTVKGQPNGSTEASVYDLTGRMILNARHHSPEFDLDISHAPAGIYLLMVRADSRWHIFRLING